VTHPTSSTSAPHDGTLVIDGDRATLRFERWYPHPVDRVWRAISDPDEMATWFPSNVEGERRVGSDLVFDDGAQRAAADEAGEPTRADGPMFRGRVVVHDPPHVFSFTWGGELLRFELSPDGDGTRLLFTQVLSHPSVAARNGAGWDACLRELDRLLDAPTAPERDWTDVYADYVRRIGPPTGVPSGGAVTWERATHVDAARVRAATSEPEEIGAWGAADHAGEPLRWDIQASDAGTTYRLTHGGIGADAALAATWHALLLQLDMYLAAGQLVPVDPTQWIGAYEKVLRAT
jgi:uncharacterized protein YndB with AHSA1/START domain